MFRVKQNKAIKLNVKITYKYVLSMYLLQVNLPFLKELIAIEKITIVNINNVIKIEMADFVGVFIK